MELVLNEAETGAVKARLGSVSPVHLARILDISRAAYKLLNEDLPKILGTTPKKLLEPDDATATTSANSADRATLP